MKNWLVILTLFFTASTAIADGVPAKPATGTAVQAAPAPGRPQATAPKRKLGCMPHGDLRHCLSKGNNMAIIRCAEKPGQGKP